MKFIRHALLYIAALGFLFEAWLWDVLSVFWLWLGRIPVIRRARQLFDALVATLPPYGALALFVLPALVIFPFKLAALWLLAHGNLALGGLAFLLAKTASMGLAAFLFELTRPKLMTIPWFLRLYGFLLQARDWAHRLIDPYLIPVKQAIGRYRKRLAGLLGSSKSRIVQVLLRLRKRINMSGGRNRRT